VELSKHHSFAPHLTGIHFHTSIHDTSKDKSNAILVLSYGPGTEL
jgi:hypothetical protein